jgi:predicted RNase H-like HicB family nuclease
MDTNTLTNKHNYDVLIEQKGQNKVTATVLGWQDCQTEGATKEEALNKLRQILTTRLQQTEIVSLEIQLPQPEHPWSKFAGMYQNNPLFPEVLEDIKAYRQQLDRQNDEESKA